MCCFLDTTFSKSCQENKWKLATMLSDHIQAFVTTMLASDNKPLLVVVDDVHSSMENKAGNARLVYRRPIARAGNNLSDSDDVTDADHDGLKNKAHEKDALVKLSTPLGIGPWQIVARLQATKMKVFQTTGREAQVHLAGDSGRTTSTAVLATSTATRFGIFGNASMFAHTSDGVLNDVEANELHYVTKYTSPPCSYSTRSPRIGLLPKGSCGVARLPMNYCGSQHCLRVDNAR
ncbi:Aste57867_22245 [Aphanomyces stellatus]|uniref:Aste57867_22245 protein n=1 Tax=Aphanomyces stellatus TaxID=120398 RepID=A0A485LKC7_9STRA|nr:hypothetical protein As57867_022176 [Aphanomyces stellatus]VFT98912.1 Aste57867_22245 [Aphanomyces stellatus]